MIPIAAKNDEMLAVDEALEKLAAPDKTKAELVKLLYFVGPTIPEAAPSSAFLNPPPSAIGPPARPRCARVRSNLVVFVSPIALMKSRFRDRTNTSIGVERPFGRQLFVLLARRSQTLIVRLRQGSLRSLR